MPTRHFNERTGDPVADNRARTRNRTLALLYRQIHVTGPGRRKRKAFKRAHGGAFIRQQAESWRLHQLAAAFRAQWAAIESGRVDTAPDDPAKSWLDSVIDDIADERVL